MNEKQVFFGICKAIKGIQVNYGGTMETIMIDYANLEMVLKANQPKKVFAICYKLQERGLIKVNKNKYGFTTTTFQLSTKGINYIKSLRGSSKA